MVVMAKRDTSRVTPEKASTPIVAEWSDIFDEEETEVPGLLVASFIGG